MAKNVTQKLHDQIISYQLDLRRFEAGTRTQVIAILNKMQKELVSSLANAGSLTAYSKGRKQDLLRQLRKVITEYYSKAQGELDLATSGLADAQTAHLGKMLETGILIDASVALPTATAVSRIAGNALIEGGVIADWWKRQTADVAFKVTSAIQQGIAQGETNQQVILRLVGKPGTSGALDMARSNVAALVQTAMQTVANDSRLSVFDANADVISSVEWFSAMDGHVCPRCIARTGLKWATGTHEPVGHTIPFENPPIHWNDRCVLLPVTKTFKELGIDIPEVKEGQRASKYGPVSSKTTFEDFLSRQSKAQQDEQLGAGRAQLWRDGKITLAQLIDGQGRELTLAQLRAKYDK